MVNQFMCVYLNKMTREYMHEFFKGFIYDPATNINSGTTGKYQYDEDRVNEYFDKHQFQGKLHFAIMLENTVIGDVYLKHFDSVNHTCEIGIHMVNDLYKNRGYGTQALKRMVEYAFCNLDIEAIYAETLITNHRSNKALIKAGYKLIAQNDEMCKYICLK